MTAVLPPDVVEALSGQLSPGNGASRKLVHRYSPRGAALELLGRRDGELLVSGPAGTGKSRACLEKLNIAALKYPRMRGLIVRQVRDTLTSTALATYEEFVIPELITAGGVVYLGANARMPARYRYSNKSEIWIAGLDKPSKVMSSEFDMIYIQEATELTPTGWENLTTRLARRRKMPYAQLLADCNPDAPSHWLKLRVDSGATTMLHSQHRDNPILFDAAGDPTPGGIAYMAILDRLTGVRRDRLRDGKWVAAEGVIWGSFNHSRHVIPRFDIPADWARFWVVDFGSTNPFVLQCWAEDGDGRLFMYREIYMTKRLVEDHARKILSIVAPDGNWTEPKPRKIICDHDAEDRETLRRHVGLANHPADKRVTTGLEAVEVRLRDDRLFFLEGSTVERDDQLVGARKPTCTVEEIPAYVWDISEGKKPKEQPVKEDDHGCDCVRYLVADRDLRPGGDVLRWF